MQFLVERFVPLSSQFKIILVSTSEKPFQFERTGFFFKLDLWHWSFDSENLCLTSSLQESSNLSFSWPLSD